MKSQALILCLGTTVACALAADVTVKDAAKLPLFDQHHNFTPAIKNLSSRVIHKGAALTFEKLSSLNGAENGQPSVHYQGKANRLYLDKNPPKATLAREVSDPDLDEIFGGYYHCAPAAGAMLLEYYAQLKPDWNELQIGAKPLDKRLHEIAFEMDTFGMNPAFKPEGRLGETNFFGTQIDMIRRGLRNYIKQKSAEKLSVIGTEAKWDEQAYKNYIAVDSPVLLLLDLENSTMLHAVVGFGYEADENGKIKNLLTRDPNETDLTVKIPISRVKENIRVERQKLVGGRTNDFGDVLLADANPYEPVAIEMMTFEPVPEPGSLIALGIGTAAIVRRRRQPSTRV